MGIKNIEVEVSEDSLGKIISFYIKNGINMNIRLSLSIPIEELSDRLRAMADSLDKHLAN